jgi:hypothetical protein
MTNAALNGGNPFLGALIGGVTGALLGGFGPPGLDSTAVTFAVLASHTGVLASNLSPAVQSAQATGTNFATSSLNSTPSGRGCGAGADFCEESGIQLAGILNSKWLQALALMWQLLQDPFWQPPDPASIPDPPVEQPQQAPKPGQPQPGPGPGPRPSTPTTPPGGPSPRVPVPPIVPNFRPYPFFLFPPCSTNPSACGLYQTPQPL